MIRSELNPTNRQNTAQITHFSATVNPRSADFELVLFTVVCSSIFGFFERE